MVEDKNDTFSLPEKRSVLGKKKITNILRNKEQIQQSVVAFSTAISHVNHIVAKGHTFFLSKGKIDKNGTSSESDKGHTFFPSKAT